MPLGFLAPPLPPSYLPHLECDQVMNSLLFTVLSHWFAYCLAYVYVSAGSIPDLQCVFYPFCHFGRLKGFARQSGRLNVSEHHIKNFAQFTSNYCNDASCRLDTFTINRYRTDFLVDPFFMCCTVFQARSLYCWVICGLYKGP